MFKKASESFMLTDQIIFIASPQVNLSIKDKKMTKADTSLLNLTSVSQWGSKPARFTKTALKYL